MNKYLLTAFIGVFLFNTSEGQDMRKLVEYERTPWMGIFLYNSDSLIYGYSYDTSHNLHYLVFNGKAWKTLDLTDGLFFTSKNSKVYFLEKKAFSIIDPKTQKKVKSYPVNFKYLPVSLRVFKDSFFIAYGNNSDTSFYKYNFDEKKISPTFLFKNIHIDDAKLVNDSILYLQEYGILHRKNLKSGSFSKSLISSNLYNYDYKDNKLIILNNHNHVFISMDYGKSFKDIDVSKYGGFMALPVSMNISNSGFSMIANSYSLVNFDFSGNQTGIFKVEPIFKNLVANYMHSTCHHYSFDLVKLNWLNDSTLLIASSDGDIYKVYPFKNNRIKYLGGSHNLGVNKARFNNKGNLLFIETGNSLWSFSSDTGKTWQIPEMSMQPEVKKLEFIDSGVLILCNDKLNNYHFGINKIDTSLYSLGLKIKDFALIDNETILLFTNVGTYILNLKTLLLNLVSPTSPFDKYTYIKKWKRLLAVGNVDIFYSDDFGKTWSKSGLTGYEFFNSISFENSLNVKEISRNSISLNVIFNGSFTLLKSNDGGKNFYILPDTVFRNLNSAIELYDDIYVLKNDNRILKYDVISKVTAVDSYEDDCPAIGMQAVDSGFYIWNSRAEIYYKKVPYKKVHTYSEKISLFPNPVNSGSNLKIRIPKDIIDRINDIELYDMLGKKHGKVSFEYSEEQNIYEVRNLPNKGSQFYVVVIKMLDGARHREKVFIY